MQVAHIDMSQCTPQDLERLYALASDQRRVRADRYLRPEDWHRCIVADGLLRRALRQSGREEYPTFHQGEHGKPSLAGDSGFHFNLSHSGNYVAIAYGSSPVGLDVETYREGKQLTSICEKFFTQAERDYITQSSEHTQLQRFFRIWTGKESYLKYLGTGLSHSLNTVCVLSDEAALGVRFHTVYLPHGCMTLCTTEENVTFQSLSPSDLL